MKRLLLIAAVLAAFGCRTPADPEAPPDAKNPPGVDPDAPGDPDPATTLAPPKSSRRGVAHTGNIDRVALSPSGKAAVTRDNVGSVRLWPALDGSEEPMVIPARNAQALSVAQAQPGTLTVFAVDASAGGRIFSVDTKTGKIAEKASLPPFSPLLEGHVVDSGSRVVTLHKDHSIRLVDLEGKELAKFSERRFRPKQLRVGRDGRTLVAIVEKSQAAGAFKIELQPLKITKAGIERNGAPRIVEMTVPPSPSTVAVSPDSRRVAVTKKPNGNKWEIAILNLAKKKEDKTHQAEIASHVTPAVGFASNTEVVVSGNDGALGWVFDLEDATIHPRTSPPQDFVHQGKVHAVAGGVQVTGYGTWLWVHNIEQRRHRFLGYRTFAAMTVAVSPKGKFVAWGHAQGPIFVEPRDAGKSKLPTARIDTDQNSGASKIRFLDEDHLIIIDQSGGITLRHWSTGKVVDRAGINGAPRSVHFDPKRGLLLVDRHNNDARVFEVSKKGFIGPYIVADQSYRLGLLAPASGDKVMWTLDSTNKLREYTLAELRSDLSRAEIQMKGLALKPSEPAPLAVDRGGRRYGVRWNGSKMELFTYAGEKQKSLPVPSGDINQIVPSPTGDLFVAVRNRGQSVSIAARRSDTLEELWSYSTGIFNNEISFSADGKYVGVAANTGAILLDARTGRAVRQRCGLEFEVLGAPPPTAFNALNQRSLCEP